MRDRLPRIFRAAIMRASSISYSRGNVGVVDNGKRPLSPKAVIQMATVLKL